MNASLLTTCLAVLFTTAAAAQLTLTDQNFNRPDTWLDTIYQDIDFDEAPVAGADVRWDLTTAVMDSFRVRSYTATSVAGLPEANTGYPFVTLFDDRYRIPSTAYEGLNGDRYARLGDFVEDGTFSLADRTGSAGDSIRFVGGLQPYVGGAREFLKFPASFGSRWASAYYSDSPYELSVAAFGLNKTPGAFRTTYEQVREVVGWGQARFQHPLTGKVEVHDALLVRLDITRRDSVYLGGAPAPSTLLDAFGLVQGDSVVIVSHVLYGLTDPGVPLLISDDSFTGADFRFHAGNLTSGISTPRASITTLDVYPSPAAGGETITLTYASELPAGSTLYLIGLDGRTLKEQVITGRSIQLAVPNNSTPGRYLAVVRSRSGATLASGSLVVH